jgi:hypothetical protein
MDKPSTSLQKKQTRQKPSQERDGLQRPSKRLNAEVLKLLLEAIDTPFGIKYNLTLRPIDNRVAIVANINTNF